MPEGPRRCPDRGNAGCICIFWQGECGLLKITKGYFGLLKVTKYYYRLVQLTSSLLQVSSNLPRVTKVYFMLLKVTSIDYRLKSFTSIYSSTTYRGCSFKEYLVEDGVNFTKGKSLNVCFFNSINLMLTNFGYYDTNTIWEIEF